MKILFVLVLSSLIAFSASSQGSIRGKVSDRNTGEEIIGAGIILEGTYKGIMTDLDGSFSLDGLESGTYNLVCSFISYQNDTIRGIKVSDGEVVIQDFKLGTEPFVIDDIAEVTARANRGGENTLNTMQKKSARVLDGVSSESMKKIGDKDAVSAIQRVTGVSTVGNNVYVRGLSDRYSKTTINGAEIPSIDPRKNSVQMDLFPTTLLDNLVVYKTFTPDLPGDFTGGLVEIGTKDFPDSFNFQYSGSLGYNENATFNNDFLSSQKSDTDWLGFDNGDRDIPASTLNTEEVPVIDFSNYYEALVYGGYENDLNALGIDNPFDIGIGSNQTSINEIINSVDGINDINQVNDLLSEVREVENAQLSQMGQDFPNSWSPVKEQGGMDMSHSISFGNQVKTFGKTLGYNFGLTYAREYDYYAEGSTGRYSLTGSEDGVNNLNTEQEFTDWRGDETARWSALFNVNLKLNENNKIGAIFMPIRNGINSSRYQLGTNPSDEQGLGQEQRTQRYLEREMNIYQLKGEHYLPGASELKIDWTASYTKGRQNTPDMRVFYNSFVPVDVTTYYDPQGVDITGDIQDEIDYLIGEEFISSPTDSQLGFWLNEEFGIQLGNIEVNEETQYDIRDNLYPSPTRFYREMEEGNLDIKLNFEIPFENVVSRQNKLMWGGSLVQRTRELNENRYSFINSGVEYNGNPDDYFANDNMVIVPGGDTGYIYLRNDTEIQNSYSAEQTVKAVYGMVDYNPTAKLRLIAGVRAEATDMLIESRKLDELTANDKLRNEFRGTLDLIDILPSLSATYQLQKEDLKVTNLRVAGSKTLARPSFREKAPFASYDFESQYVFVGNPDLDRVLITNADIRLEHYPFIGEIISVSGFYKSFQNPIEQVINPSAPNVELTWENVAEARVLGAEFEVKKSFRFLGEKYTPFGIGFNVTAVDARTSIDPDELEQIRATDPNHKTYRPMFGQAPWIVNTFLTYDNDSTGLSASLGFNMTGKKLVLVTKGGTPDVYDQPRASLDLSVSKTIGKNWSLGVKARNLLDAEYRRTYEFKGQDYVWQSFTMGRSYSLGISYRIQ